MCERFESTLESDAYQTTSPDERYELLHQRVYDPIQHPKANETLSALASASPEDKYRLLKESIETQTGQSWSCPGMRP